MSIQAHLPRSSMLKSIATCALRAALAFVVLCLGAATATWATESSATKAVTLENLFKDKQFGKAVISPDGKHLAVTTSIKGRRHLAVVDVATRAVTPVGGFPDFDVWNFYWISNNR